jgi:hypothetical protein
MKKRISLRGTSTPEITSCYGINIYGMEHHFAKYLCEALQLYIDHMDGNKHFFYKKDMLEVIRSIELLIDCRVLGEDNFFKLNKAERKIDRLVAKIDKITEEKDSKITLMQYEIDSLNNLVERLVHHIHGTSSTA